MSKKQTSAITIAIVSIITVVGVGTYNVHVGNNTNINDNSGDEVTNFFGELGEDFAYEATMTAICSKSPIDPEYVGACEEWESEP